MIYVSNPKFVPNSACESVGRSIAPVRRAPGRSAWCSGQERPSTISSSCGGVEGHAAAYLRPYAPCKVDDPIPQITAGTHAKQTKLAAVWIGSADLEAGIKPGPQDSISQFTGGPNLGEATAIPQWFQPRSAAVAPILRRAAA